MNDVQIKNRITTFGLIVLASAMLGVGLLHRLGAIGCVLVAIAALPAIRLRPAAKWPLVLVLSLSSCGAGLGATESRAEKLAKDFCEQFQVGQKLEAAALAARDEGNSAFRSSEPDEVTVGYTGVFPLSRHMCIITAEGGLVVEKRYAFLD